VTVVGWDIGGVNTKVARVETGTLCAVRGRPFEVQRAPAALVSLLRDLAADVGAPANPSLTAHAVTMTAELSQMFRTKREGVTFVLDAVESAFPGARVQVFTVDGVFVDPDEARARPLAAAAANWVATATLVARHHRDALLVDIGTTTTDLIPITGGAVVAEGRTDPDRLASGELVYTGALRTPAEAMASHVAIGGRTIGVSAENFALAGDVHIWRGNLAPADYTVPTPDGRPATRECAGERLARVICADREMLDEQGVSQIADALADAQIERVATAMRRISARHPSLRTAVVTGLGAFIGDTAARTAGFDVVRLSAALGEDGARCAPAASVALLLSATSLQSPVSSLQSPVPSLQSPVPSLQSPVSSLQSSSPEPRAKSPEPRVPSPEPRATSPVPRATSPEPRVELVVKVGGGLLAHRDDFDRALRGVAELAREQPLLVIPGGGPFADAVRDVDDRVMLSDESAHWMAMLAMDQYAHVLAERLPNAALVSTRREILAAVGRGRLPVLAPSSWLREADPLPHSWDVTSDSIAAWVAGAIDARRLILLKPSGATGSEIVDPYFKHALPCGVESVCVPADQIGVLLASAESVRE
jgi:probable H4MPT-linked C1 transfer pathway protein